MKWAAPAKERSARGSVQVNTCLTLRLDLGKKVWLLRALRRESALSAPPQGIVSRGGRNRYNSNSPPI